MFENKFRQAFPSTNEGHLINTIETEERERERERERAGGRGRFALDRKLANRRCIPM